jgi:hypothetical protein
MSKIQKPFGRITKRIIIEADEHGTVRVNAFDIPLIVRPNPPRMDSREMVLALMKVVMDYTSALFSNMNFKAETDGDEQASEDQNASNKRSN